MSKDNYIYLGRRPEKYDSPAVSGDAKKEDSVYYPTLMFSTDKPCGFPEGVFGADVEVKVKRSEASEDEKGKKRYSYTLEIRGIEPQEDEDDDSEETDSDEGEEEAADAASSLMESMQKARGKKMAEADEDEE